MAYARSNRGREAAISLASRILFSGIPPVLLAGSQVWAAPLHDAARQGDAVVIERLAEQGIDLEALDESNLTPLVTAALAGQENVVSLLITLGADPSGRDGKGFMALHAAAHAGHAEIVELLVGLPGIDVNDQRNDAKLTPLHAAAERNYPEIVELLLARGARVDVVEGSGWTPVMRATFKSHADMVRLLREHGAACTESAGEQFFNFCMNAGR